MGYKGISIPMDDMVCREGYKGDLPIFPSNSICIDMDQVEKLRSLADNRERQKSIDSTYMIDDGETSEAVLVEYKLNYVNNVNNFSLTDTKSKCEASEAVLKEFGACIHPKVYCVFHTNFIEEARNRLYRRFLGKMPPPYVVVDVARLSELHFVD